MVMVLGQLLDKLEAGKVVGPSQPAHYRRRLKVSQVAVGRAPGQLRQRVFDVGNANGTSEGQKNLDDCPAAIGVALPVAGQTSLHTVMDLYSLLLCEHWPPHQLNHHSQPGWAKDPTVHALATVHALGIGIDCPTCMGIASFGASISFS